MNRGRVALEHPRRNGNDRDQRVEFEVPEGLTSVRLETFGGSGDPDLYVRHNAIPTRSEYDCKSATGGTDSCVFEAPEPGFYVVGLWAYTSFSEVTLLGSLDDSGGEFCADGQLYSGTLAATGDVAYEPADGPIFQGFRYLGSHLGTSASLIGTGSDFDLHLYRWQNSDWEMVDSSASTDSEESVSYAGAGHFAYVVESYSGSGSYSLCITTTP